MANWVDNELDVLGPKPEVEQFLKIVDGGSEVDDGKEYFVPFDFNKILPYPAHYAEADKAAREFKGAFKDRPKDGFNNGGFEWRCENWGTRTNASYLVNVREIKKWYKDEYNGIICFCTASEPPIPVVRAASEQFPNLRFSLFYTEVLARFDGVFVAEKGHVLLDERGGWDPFTDGSPREVKLTDEEFHRFEALAQRCALRFSGLARSALRMVEAQINERLLQINQGTEARALERQVDG